MKTNRMIFATLIVLGACRNQDAPAPAALEVAPARAESAKDEAWNGGKQTPFVVTSSVKDRVAEDVDLTIPLAITPHRDCTGLTSVVRGIDGVVVRDVGARRSFATGARGATLSHPIVARVPAGTAGYVVVDVSAVVDGQTVRASYPVPLRGPNAVFARGASGETVVGPGGERVVRMIATER